MQDTTTNKAYWVHLGASLVIVKCAKQVSISSSQLHLLFECHILLIAHKYGGTCSHANHTDLHGPFSKDPSIIFWQPCYFWLVCFFSALKVLDIHVVYLHSGAGNLLLPHPSFLKAHGCHFVNNCHEVPLQ